MSSCGNCDCSDKTNCPKKGNSFGIEIVQTEMSYDNFAVSGAEGDCKCGPSCTCTDCKCGH